MKNYLEKYSHYKKPLISDKIKENTSFIIVIPCFNEPSILPTLNSLKNCIPPNFPLEVIIVINASEAASENIIQQNKFTKSEIEKWLEHQSVPWLTLHILEENNLPKKHAGVGLARKIGMDEALWRFYSIQKDYNGIVICLDADSLVEPNYLIEIEQHFSKNTKTPACSIHFEHPLDAENSDEIINYELHLRYFINAQRFAKHPHAFQTVGSSMAVRASIYAQQGGMPKRQAGEDFYFLHKIIPLGNFTELNATQTIPSPRSSDRVPFGTGKDISNQINFKNEYTTYNFNTFIDLKNFLSQLETLYSKNYQSIPLPIQTFLKSIDGFTAIEQIINNTSQFLTFEKQFFNWFNGFMVMKFAHFARDNYYKNEKLLTSSLLLLKHLDIQFPPNASKKEILLLFRKLDKNRTSEL